MIHFPDARKVVDQAEASVVAMEQLLDALLDISKLDAGILTPHLEDFRLNALLARMQNSFAAAAAAKGLRLRAVPSHLVVRSDPVLLERIMMNLVSNAVRYTERGGVVIGCRRRGADVRIEVWDSGLGIPDDKRTAVFQEFFQLTDPGRDRSKGLGLGLAIVERLARLLQHRIELRSTPGRGSAFAIVLPAGDAQRVIATPPAAQTVDRHLRGAFVVVVDDEALVRDGMRGLLTGWGCHVLAAGSGDEALAQLAAHERIPDLIVSDYRLRDGENGIDVIHRLHAALTVPIPSVLISGDTAPERLREATASGYHLLHKPVQPAKLRAMLSYVLSAAAQHRVQA
jgi:CheY-like chemotaxis protein/anti-sigma regulatory factor (Ser/Thr protein kinase)